MKKTYIKPELNVHRIRLTGMVALSTIEGKTASKGSTVLTREDNSWDIWGNEDDFED